MKSTFNILTNAPGVSVQKASSLGIGSLSTEGFEIHGVRSFVEFSVGDWQGNLVPDGASFNFVFESKVVVSAKCVKQTTDLNGFPNSVRAKRGRRMDLC